jgi:phosphate starvation-inducible membrane PsiE
VQFLEGRLATIVRILLSGHARGLILALSGAVLLLVVLLSVLRVRVRARGTVVGREQRTRRQNDRLVT